VKRSAGADHAVIELGSVSVRQPSRGLRFTRRACGIRLEVFFCVLILLADAGCRSQTIRIPSYRIEQAAHSATFAAGAAKRDITPPAGFPMGGYSVDGKVARGHWMRLYARAFYFRDAAGRQLALVSCDLFAIPRGLHAKVSYELASEGVGADELILAATHTHQSPGNYMSSRLYNGFASPLPGFREDLLEFLTHQIAGAVEEAIAASRGRTPAHLVLKTGRIDDLVRNRSPEAFEKNLDREATIRDGPTAPPNCPGDCPRYRAVYPTAEVLEVHHQTPSGSERTAALVFFALHPTAMSDRFAFYSPDLVGRATRRLENDSPVAGFVAGFFNGAEGDVSPRWEKRDASEVRQLGDLLAGGVQRLLDRPDGTRDDDPRIRTRFKSVRRSEFCGGAEPMFGVAVVGGAADGRTAFYELGWQRGPNAIREGRPIKGQGRKQPALDAKWLPGLKVSELLSPPRDFPREVPVSVAEIGPLFVAAVPVEMTTTMGRRLRAALSSSEPGRRVAIVGLANEYLSYVTTPEEYDLQDYEGGSTIFGPSEGECFSKLLDAARADLDQPPQLDIAASSFAAGEEPLALFGPEYWSEHQPWWTPELANRFAKSSPSPSDRWPRFEWIATRRGMQETVDQRVTLLERSASGWSVAETEDDSNLLLVLVDGGPPRHWNATWVPPIDADREGRYAFEVVRADGSRHCSIPFFLKAVSEGRVALPLPAMDCSALRAS
jgi:neutral ceramidase